MNKKVTHTQINNKNSSISLRSKTQRWYIVGFCVFFLGSIVAFLGKWTELWVLLKSPNPIAFAPLIIPLSLVGVYYLVAQKENDGRGRSLFQGTVVFAFILAIIILRFAFFNVWESWQITFLLWPILLAVGVFIFFGLKKSLVAWPLLLYAFLLWPPVLIFLHTKVSPFLTDIVSWVVVILAKVFSLPLTETDTSLHIFKLEGQDFQAIIGTSCSGSSSILGIVILLFPLLFILKGSLWRKAIWFACAPILAFLGNILRTYLVFQLAHSVNPEVAYNWFHTFAGLLLFGILTLLMLLFLVPFGLRFRVTSSPGMTEGEKKYLVRGLIFFIFLSTIFWLLTTPANFVPANHKGSLEDGVVQKDVTSGGEESTEDSGLKAIGSFVVEDIPRSDISTYDPDSINENVSKRYLLLFKTPNSYLPPIENYDYSVTSFDFADSLFGDTADYERFRYRRDDGLDLPIFVDAIVTDDKDSLLGLSTGYCYRYHGYKILYDEKIDLGENIIGYFYSYQDEKGRDWESVDFTTPVYDENDGQKYYRRVKIVKEVVGGTDEDYSITRKFLENFAYTMVGSLQNGK